MITEAVGEFPIATTVSVPGNGGVNKGTSEKSIMDDKLGFPPEWGTKEKLELTMRLYLKQQFGMDDSDLTFEQLLHGCGLCGDDCFCKQCYCEKYLNQPCPPDCEACAAYSEDSVCLKKTDCCGSEEKK
jgi:hypothetical protein